ncbi:beta-N-acetylhexosaminidase [Oceanobacillus sp. 143]|uniref:beta-N-acetylhexosaminidase n=1 Tax=Oceanobacillus zhaokaii TaxID=2052660 RepID=A0A345PJ76_9BACI|nr:glycoside hydrolase family 3 protein [Oceanobacillus zhaokaii]AXI10056.1 beta-N-acetylhexosaminidase [Oceanobacillus zhaokaii]QGS69198.1 beta-N-acetylhexosaminidase [Oceanobacillus sp. 143]
MKRWIKASFMLFATVALLISPYNASNVEAQNSKEIDNLVILQNIPEAEIKITNNQIDLNALHLYNDGHFKEVSDNLTWRSKNKNVATVNQDGIVTFTGQNGRSWITVTDGKSTDEIAVHHKKSDQLIIKQEGKRYNIIDNAIKGMTLNEKIGQMLMPDFRNWNGKNVTEMLPEIEQMVKDYHLGGVILFAENVVTTEQTTKLVAAYQDAAEKYGLLLTIDQEGGIVGRLQSGTYMPGNMALGATRSTVTAENVGSVISKELNALGINMNLAPVLDVNNNPDNPVIGVRSFGETPELVADLGISYIKGIQSNGVAATAKHFPGHGDTAVDSHLGLPEVPHDKERLLEVELLPFQKAMDANIDAIMTAHVTFPKIDNTKVISKKDGTEISLPATLSPKVLTGLMREEMGYDGVIITDALNMAAISEHFGAVDAVIRTVKAGTDIILMPVGLEEVVNGLLEAVETGEITEERIEESVRRILTLKINRGVIKTENPVPVEQLVSNAEAVVGSDSHKQVEAEAANQSITLLKNNSVLPLQVADEDKIVVIGNTYINNLHEAITKYHSNTELVRATGPLTNDQIAELQDARAVIFGSYTFNVSGRAPSSPQMQLVNQLIEQVDAPVVGVGIRNPYDIMAFSKIDAYLAQYGFRDASFKATAATIFGDNNPVGQLPVTIPDLNGDVLYPFGSGLSY